jgi:hypothetical protein
VKKQLTLVAIVAAVALSACGGSEEPTSDAVPAAGENTPPAGTPGVPPGAAYDLDGTAWLKLPQVEQFAAAQAYIDDNAARCEGADAADVATYVTTSYGADFPPDIAAAEVLAEGCDAERQS